MVTGKSDLTLDHHTLEDALATRRYFAKFDGIHRHLGNVAKLALEEDPAVSTEVAVVGEYLDSLNATFQALSQKYLMAGRVSEQLPKSLGIDRQESGFPIYQELLQMANDALQADRHLAGLPGADALKQDMIRHIMVEQTPPTRLQFALSQRLYYEGLRDGGCFLAQNDPQIEWLGNDDDGRRTYLLHWATYDSQMNIPTIYLMVLTDSNRKALPKDEKRWPQVQAHLMAQSVAALKLVTIARGFDRDFDDLHPKILRRIHVGPMYSHTYTQQTGPLRDVLAESGSEPGSDWALAWTVESLQSDRVEEERKGIFGSVEREIFKLDHFDGGGAVTGASALERSLILPQRPYQVLEERNPEGFRGVQKFVVSPKGQIVRHV